VIQFRGKYIKGQGHTGILYLQLKCTIAQYRVVLSTS